MLLRTTVILSKNNNHLLSIKAVSICVDNDTSTTAISARVKPVPVSIEPKRESPILQDIICAPGATPLSRGSYKFTQNLEKTLLHMH